MAAQASRGIGHWGVRTAAAAALAVAGGCMQQRAKPLTPDSFVAPHPVYDRSRVQPVDQPGPLMYEGTAPPARRIGAPPAWAEEGQQPGTAVSPTVEQSVRPVREEGFQVPDPAAAQGKGEDDDGAPPGVQGAVDTGPTTRATPDVPPTTRPVETAGPGPTGTYQVVGTVLADVNSAPIFADRVLGVLDSALAASAKQMDERQFRTKAAELITKQVREYIANELEFAMARSKLDARDQQLASAAATKWREEQITRAGGSAEVAKQQWAAKGLDFEEQVEEQYRTLMVQLYYQRKEYPKIQVTAEDKRRYYQQNLATEFSQPDRAQFRVIMIDPRRRGSRREALGEINRLLDRVRSGGADFAQLAASDQSNDNPSFRQPAGWIARGAFVVPEVEQAVWNLRPGQVTDVIETPNGFYLAKVEELQQGKVFSFTEPAVQLKIQLTLQKQQFDSLRHKAQRKLINDAIIRYNPDNDERKMLHTAVEMAVQKYNYWRTARS